jgi:hypothetical protein
VGSEQARAAALASKLSLVSTSQRGTAAGSTIAGSVALAPHIN